MSTLQFQHDPSTTEIYPATSKEEVPESVSTQEDGKPVKTTTCSLCKLSFATVQDQRQHVRSDLHGYNLKQKMRGLKPVEEAEFEKMVGGMLLWQLNTRLSLI